MALTGFRLASAADAPAIHAIYAPIVRESAISFEYDPPAVDEIAARIGKVLEGGYPWIVAEADGRIPGYAYATVFRARTAYSWSAEVSVYVDADARGRGIGRELYAVLLRTLELQGFRAAYAMSTAPNPASEALHRAAGFELLGRLPAVGWKFEQWHDTLLWRVALGAGAASAPGPIADAADALARVLAERQS